MLECFDASNNSRIGLLRSKKKKDQLFQISEDQKRQATTNKRLVNNHRTRERVGENEAVTNERKRGETRGGFRIYIVRMIYGAGIHDRFVTTVTIIIDPRPQPRTPSTERCAARVKCERQRMTTGLEISCRDRR